MILKSKPVKMPSGLGVSRKLWRDIVSEYIEFEPHHLKLLQLICETWDKVVGAREVLQKDGSYFVDRYGQPKEHPAADAERKNKTLFMRLVRELGLDITPPSEQGRGKQRY